MKKILAFIFLVFAISNAQGQTITKTASKSSVYIGEEFFYTIKIEGLSDLSDLNRIEDNFGPELDYLGVEYNSSMLYLLNIGYGIGCASYNDNNSTLHSFLLNFYNCNGFTFAGLDSFSFKIKVKLNREACIDNTYDNKISLYLKSQPTKPIESEVESITINKNDPFVLQKTFRSDNSGVLVYDIRLSSESGNFYPLDFTSNPRFKDEFTIPSCLTVGTGINDIAVVQITDENATPMTQNSTFSFNKNITASSVILDWSLQGATQATSSILYQVKIKIDDCSACGNSFLQLKNDVYFDAKDLCGNPINKSKQSVLDNGGCVNGKLKIPVPIPDSKKICIEKRVELDGNTLNYTMKGCTGKYVININNCSGRIIYKDFKLTDIIPQELSVNGAITINGNATHSLNNNTLTVSETGYLNPNDTVQVIIPFEVTTPNDGDLIDNCVTISLYGYDSINTNIPYNVTKTTCATTIKTVPNEVALVVNKKLCSDAKNTCGPFTNTNNLPGDTVEYALHFYNYGTVEAEDILIKDALPQHFKIQGINTDVKVYRVERENVSNACKVEPTMKDITQHINKSYSPSTNLLELKIKKLEEFTCKGMVQYIIKIKAKIDLNAPNGTYENVYSIEYKDPSTSNSHIKISNKVSNVVNVDNLVIGMKTVEGGPYYDCENKKATVRYNVTLANMGTFNVVATVNDILNVPSPVNVVNFGNFQKSVNGSPFSSFAVANATNSGFNNLNLLLKPCEVTVITYDVVYDTNLISKGQSIRICNDATVSIKSKIKKKIIPVITSNPSLIQNYLDAKTDTQKLEVISLIKAVKQYPEILNNTSKDKYARKSKLSKSNNNFNFGTQSLAPNCRAGVTLKDCLPSQEKDCFSKTSQDFDFRIDGMNASGEISTTLDNNSNEQITKIEYILTDVRQTKECNSRRFWWRGRRWRQCIGSCLTNVVGRFAPINTNSINGTLNLVNLPNISGRYREYNKVEYEGVPTTVNLINQKFKFPVSVNCNGTFEFTITAIVHFEDCSVCYVTDVFDYNARWRPIRILGNPILTSPPFTRR